jgi:hypothetical protein
MAIEEKNMELMKTLDDAWNSQDWDTFNDRHADDVAVFCQVKQMQQEECKTIVKNP